MKSFGLIAVLAAGFLVGPAVHAQQATAPTGSTGQCKDGTYTTNATKRGACSGHQGVKDWYNTPAVAPTTPAKPAAPAAPLAAPASTATPHVAAPVTGVANSTPAPGGGPGLVWVNTSSKVYHCQGDKWYGNTKAGAYMSEADAKAKGFRGENGKDCTK